MRNTRYVGDIVTFVVAAVLVYIVGTALRAGLSMWGTMGLDVWPGWPILRIGIGPGLALLVLLAAALIAGLVWWLRRLSQASETGDSPPAERCPRCGASVEPDYVLCPECQTTLQQICSACGQAIRSRWSRCPYCGAETTKTLPAGDAAEVR